MAIDLEKVIERAMASGFDAELKVAAILRKAGWSTQQNVYYIDKDEKIGREVDIVCSKPFQMTSSTPEVTCRIYLCVEVKRSTDPFIFFTDTPQGFEGGRGFGVLHWRKNVSGNILSYKNIEHYRPLRDVPRLARTYSSFKDGKTQHMKSGIVSAFKGAVHQAENTDETYSDTSHDICFFIPVVVVDGLLFEAYFPDNSDQLTAAPIQAAAYIQNYMSTEYGELSTCVNVVTMQQLPVLLDAYKTWGNSLLSAMVAKRSRLPETAD